MEFHTRVTLLLAIGVAACLFSLATLAWGCTLAFRRRTPASKAGVERARVRGGQAPVPPR